MQEKGLPIGQKQVLEAAETMRRYKRGKARLESNIIENERWFLMKNTLSPQNRSGTESRSAWLLNALLNKHADAMDNYPEPIILPREKADEPDATMLSSVLPVVLENNRYEQVYSDIWWYKVKQGTGVHGVFWNPDKDGGLGDVEIRKMDLLNLYWEPGVTDIQDSRHLFHATLWDTDSVRGMYPSARDLTHADTGEIARYVYDDALDTSDKTLVVDWYYRKDGLLHLCKFAQDVVLFATENDPVMRETGLYAHGRYPFVFDPLFPLETGPAGSGFIDMMRGPQELIDKLDGLILDSAAYNARPRYFLSDQAGVNEKEFADTSRDFVHVTGPINPSHFQPVARQALGAEVYAMRQNKIEELKETSGNRDVSTGGTTAGVTAASAIAAMQEAGSKLSRDMIKSSHRAFTEVCYLALELIREFYTLPRSFRIVGEDGANDYITYQNSRLNGSADAMGLDPMDTGRRPVFDIRVKTQKASPYSRMAQNEMARQLFGMGLFDPNRCDEALMVLDMMDFEGRERLRAKLAQNGTLAEQLKAMQAQMQKMAAIIDKQNGTQLTQGMAGEQAQTPVRASAGEAFTEGGMESAITQKARARAAQAASPG